jgi:hypothetical protein
MIIMCRAPYTYYKKHKAKYYKGYKGKYQKQLDKDTKTIIITCKT